MSDFRVLCHCQKTHGRRCSMNHISPTLIFCRKVMARGHLQRAKYPNQLWHSSCDHLRQWNAAKSRSIFILFFSYYICQGAITGHAKSTLTRHSMVYTEIIIANRNIACNNIQTRNNRVYVSSREFLICFVRRNWSFSRRVVIDKSITYFLRYDLSVLRSAVLEYRTGEKPPLKLCSLQSIRK